MPSCLYNGCKIASTQKNKQISFHRIPKEGSLRDIWVCRIGRQYNKENVQDGFVCSNHFQKRHLIRLSTSTNLARNALPIQHVQKYYEFEDVDMDENWNISSCPKVSFPEPIDVPMIGINVEIGKANPEPDFYEDFYVQMNSSNISKEHNYSKPANSAISIQKLSERLNQIDYNENYLYEYVNIIAYISGFVAKRLASILKCGRCINALITADENENKTL